MFCCWQLKCCLKWMHFSFPVELSGNPNMDRPKPKKSVNVANFSKSELFFLLLYSMPFSGHLLSPSSVHTIEGVQRDLSLWRLFKALLYLTRTSRNHLAPGSIQNALFTHSFTCHSKYILAPTADKLKKGCIEPFFLTDNQPRSRMHTINVCAIKNLVRRCTAMLVNQYYVKKCVNLK